MMRFSATLCSLLLLILEICLVYRAPFSVSGNKTTNLNASAYKNIFVFNTEKVENIIWFASMHAYEHQLDN